MCGGHEEEVLKSNITCGMMETSERGARREDMSGVTDDFFICIHKMDVVPERELCARQGHIVGVAACTRNHSWSH